MADRFAGETGRKEAERSGKKRARRHGARSIDARLIEKVEHAGDSVISGNPQFPRRTVQVCPRITVRHGKIPTSEQLLLLLSTMERFRVI